MVKRLFIDQSFMIFIQIHSFEDAKFMPTVFLLSAATLYPTKQNRKLSHPHNQQ